jgi:hypothetical protein
MWVAGEMIKRSLTDTEFGGEEKALVEVLPRGSEGWRVNKIFS